MKLLKIFVGCLSWMTIFFSPFCLFFFIALVVYLQTQEWIFPGLIVLAGAGLGAWAAEFVRRKYGLTFFLGKLLSTPELDEPGEKEEQ